MSNNNETTTRAHAWSDDTIRDAMKAADLSGPVAWEWAHGVAESVAEYLTDGMPEYPEDLAHEIAEAAVPAYDSEQWSLFAALDLWAHLEDLTERTGEIPRPEEVARLSIYWTALDLAVVLLSPPALWEAMGLEPDAAQVAAALTA